jgi:hypothetical protein
MLICLYWFVFVFVFVFFVEVSKMNSISCNWVSYYKQQVSQVSTQNVIYSLLSLLLFNPT